VQQWTPQDQQQQPVVNSSRQPSSAEDWFAESHDFFVEHLEYLSSETAFATGPVFDLNWFDDTGGVEGAQGNELDELLGGRTTRGYPTTATSAPQHPIITHDPSSSTVSQTHRADPVLASSSVGTIIPVSGTGSSSDTRSTSHSKRSSRTPEPETRHQKRQRNTEAARRYRQRKVDRVTGLEEALALMTEERNELRLKLAKAETEAGVLRDLVGGRRT